MSKVHKRLQRAKLMQFSTNKMKICKVLDSNTKNNEKLKLSSKIAFNNL